MAKENAVSLQGEMPKKALVRTHTTLRFVCAAQLGRYVLFAAIAFKT